MAMARCSQCGNNNAQTYHGVVPQPGASPKIYCNVCFPRAKLKCHRCGTDLLAADLRVIPPNEQVCKNCFYAYNYQGLKATQQASARKTISNPSTLGKSWAHNLTTQNIALGMLINEIGHRVRLTDKLVASQKMNQLVPSILQEFDAANACDVFVISTDLVAHKPIIDATTLGRSDHLPVDDYVLAALCKHGVKIKRSDIVNNFGKKFKFEVDTETDEDYIVIKAKELP